MTQHAYDVVERFRDLGGRLVFLSANNFFWKVEKRGQSLKRVAQWRTLKRPEARLLGVQYRANDDGTRQGPFVVPDVSVAPWLFEGTGLEDGDTLGDEVGGFGIEIDMTTPLSPPGTRVLALIPNLFGLGLHAEMSVLRDRRRRAGLLGGRPRLPRRPPLPGRDAADGQPLAPHARGPPDEDDEPES